MSGLIQLITMKTDSAALTNKTANTGAFDKYLKKLLLTIKPSKHHNAESFKSGKQHGQLSITSG
jgi:hypothetical protein